MGRRAESFIGQVNSTNMFTGGINHMIEIENGDLYAIFPSTTTMTFKKSTDGGATWSASTSISTNNTVTCFSVWYDRWSGIAAGLIHIAYTTSSTADTFYRTIDTENSDTLSTETTIFAGVSTAGGSHISVTRARGGNVYCKTVIDAGAEGGFFRLPNANVPSGAWDAARTVDEAIATLDQMILVPGFAADNQDIMAIFWDASADEISRKIYDDSANSWAESSIATSMVEVNTATTMAHFSAAVDLTNSRIIMAAWSAVDLANADLRCWTITESAITETTTNVVLNSTDDQGFSAFSLNTLTGEWVVLYGGKSDGSETWNTAINLYYKVSKDAGTTWGAETKITSALPGTIAYMSTCPRTKRPPIALYQTAPGSINVLQLNYDRVQPKAALLLGV